MSFVGPKNFALEASLGNVAGYSTINKFGQARDCDVDEDVDIWDGADGVTSTKVWVAPTTARLHDIVSTSVNDDGAPVGTGMRTVRIYGLSGWGTPEISEDVILDGTTPVTTSNVYVIIYRMEGLTFGSGGTNAGIITATAATDVTVSAAIYTGEGQTMMVIYGVPSTKKISIFRMCARVLKAGGDGGVKCDGTLLVEENADQADCGFITKERFQFTDQSPLERNYLPPKTFDGPCIVKLQVSSDTINVQVSGGFDALVADV